MRITKQAETKIWFSGDGDNQYVYVAEKEPEGKFLGGCFKVENEAELEKWDGPISWLEFDAYLCLL